VKLEHLAADVERRRTIARNYDAAFADLPLIRPIERLGCRHVYHLYVVRLDRRDAWRNTLIAPALGLESLPTCGPCTTRLVAAARIPSHWRYQRELSARFFPAALSEYVATRSRPRDHRRSRFYGSDRLMDHSKITPGRHPLPYLPIVSGHLAAPLRRCAPTQRRTRRQFTFFQTVRGTQRRTRGPAGSATSEERRWFRLRPACLQK